CRQIRIKIEELMPRKFLRDLDIPYSNWNYGYCPFVQLPVHEWQQFLANPARVNGRRRKEHQQKIACGKILRDLVADRFHWLQLPFPERRSNSALPESLGNPASDTRI